MAKYVVQRLAQGILLVLTVSILVFSLLYMMPGDPVDVMAGKRVSEERKEELRVELGLDQPLHIQYVNWMEKTLKLDFGRSIITKKPVMQSLQNRLPVTLKLSGGAMMVELLLAVPLGLLAAYKKDSFLDRFLMGAASFMQSVPDFWFAMMMILLFGATLGVLPLNGTGSWQHYIMPILSMSLAGVCSTLRITKTEVLEVFHEKYVQTAFAKGLKRRTVVIKHVLRNSLILVVVMFFMSLPWIISGSVIIENIFVIPGIGSLLTKSILQQDFPVVQACILIVSVLTVLCNLASDIVVAMLDPRVRFEISGGEK